MPLLPAFEGEFGTNSGAALQAVTHWNYSSICRGGFSLMEKLAQEVPDPNKYIVFCGLRSWDRLDGKLVSLNFSCTVCKSNLSLVVNVLA